MSEAPTLFISLGEYGWTTLGSDISWDFEKKNQNIKFQLTEDGPEKYEDAERNNSNLVSFIKNILKNT